MKNIYIALTMAFIAFAMTSCEKFLDGAKVENREDLNAAFQSEEDADMAMTGCYAQLRDRDALNGRNVYVLYDCGSQDMKMWESPNKVNNYSFVSGDDDQAFANLWKIYYQTIGRCNQLFEVLPLTTAPEEKISRYFAEAKTLRAMMHYYLMMTWGHVPLVMESIAADDREAQTKGADSRADIYSAIIQDCNEAIAEPNLPWETDYDAEDKGHVGKATAYTILTYAYLCRAWENNDNADFLNAKNAAMQIIQNGGYTLEPVLLDAYYKPYNSESIFEISSSNEYFGAGTPASSWFIPSGSGFKQAWDKLHMTLKLHDAIEEGDARRYLMTSGQDVPGWNRIWAPHFLGGSREEYGGPTDTIKNSRTDFVFGDPAFNSSKTTSPKAWVDRFSGAPHSTVGAHQAVFRLSDIYLLYAEACIKLNEPDEAVTYINKVRERARNAWTSYDPSTVPPFPGIPADIDANGNSAGKNYGSLMEALKQERRVELFGEAKRVLDLRRWSLGGGSDYKDDVQVSSNGNWNEKFKWYPIPSEQKSLSEGNLTDDY